MNRLMERMKNIGPGALVAAAFIGPGTVTTCVKAGANSGYTLLWAMLFSTIATIAFQEMSSRLGIITQMGLGENIRRKIRSPFLKGLSAVLVIIAIFVGNSAYESGNITGGIMGFQALAPHTPTALLAVIIAALATALLWNGNYSVIEKILSGIVVLMAVAFVVTGIASSPDWGAVLKGLFTPNLGNNGLMTVVGLIGTTIVPYNLFLHASSSAERLSGKKDIQEDMKNSRWDTVISISLGGIISMFIIISASANLYGTGAKVKSGMDLAASVAPVLGLWAKWLIGIGLLAAGFSSAVTAPLAAAEATGGVTGIDRGKSRGKFRAIWLIIIAAGTVFTLTLGRSPTQLILVAQAANAIILPLIAFFVLYCVNDKGMGKFRNSTFQNILGAAIIVLCCFICYRNMKNFNSSLSALFRA